ncbi:MAG: AEC family transporter [Clostridiaceae bacterium]|nr:AEC family transporter [Clostridiaceae bacterium]
MEFDFLLTLQKVLVLFLLIVIGFIAGRVNLISETGQKNITALVLNITMPATIFMAMQLEMSEERIQTALTIVLIMVGLYLLMFLVGFLVTKPLKMTIAEKDVIRTALLLSNTSFMGYPMVSSLLGEEALFYAVIGAGFVFEIVSWTLGVYMVGRNSDTSVKLDFKKIILSPGILSITVGLIFFIFQIPLPEVADNLLNTLSPATSPLAMIVVGLILSRGNIKEAFANKVLYLGSFVKLLLVPVLAWFILSTLGFSGPQLVIPVIMISMPTATYVAMFADNYNNNQKLASQFVFMSSLLSIITIPLVTLLF